MPQNVRIALDAMGGDHGAPVVVGGAAISLERHPDTEFVMVGNRPALESLLAARPALGAVTRIVHTDVAVKMDDKPSQAYATGAGNRRCGWQSMRSKGARRMSRSQPATPAR
jgi:phosphate acyltransferase